MAIPFYGQNKDGGVLDAVASGLTRGHEVMPLAADATLNAADSGKIIMADATGAAGEVDIALPAPSAGLNYKFIVKEDTPTQDIKIVATGAIVYGVIMVYFIEAGTTVDNVVLAAGSTNVLIDTTAKKGDWLDFYCDGTNWFIRGGGSVTGAFTVS